jgi:hypothetical protein
MHLFAQTKNSATFIKIAKVCHSRAGRNGELESLKVKLKTTPKSMLN